MNEAPPGCRLGIAEDIEHDPEHRRQRAIARWMVGRLLNVARGSYFFDEPADREKELNMIEQWGLEQGIIAFDEWHHAPKCPANHFHHQRMPDGPCTCGAEARKIR